MVGACSLTGIPLVCLVNKSQAQDAVLLAPAIHVPAAAPGQRAKRIGMH